MLENYFKEFNFKPLNDYVNKLEKEIVDIENNNFNDVNFSDEKLHIFRFKLKSNLNLTIKTIRINDYFRDIIRFYFLKDGNCIELISFCLSDCKLPEHKDIFYRPYMHHPKGINRFISHYYKIQDGDNVTVYSFRSNYEDNDYILGYESVRKLPYQELHKKLGNETDIDMLDPLFDIDLCNVTTTYKHDENILDEPTINSFSVDGISYESAYLKRLDELGLITDIDKTQVSDEHYKSLKKTKSNIRKDIK